MPKPRAAGPASLWRRGQRNGHRYRRGQRQRRRSGSGSGTGGGPYRQDQASSRPRLLREVRADYRQGRRKAIEGEVVLEIVVKQDGSVGDVKIMKRQRRPRRTRRAGRAAVAVRAGAAPPDRQSTWSWSRRRIQAPIGSAMEAVLFAVTLMSLAIAVGAECSGVQIMRAERLALKRGAALAADLGVDDERARFAPSNRCHRADRRQSGADHRRSPRNAAGDVRRQAARTLGISGAGQRQRRRDGRSPSSSTAFRCVDERRRRRLSAGRDSCHASAATPAGAARADRARKAWLAGGSPDRPRRRPRNAIPPGRAAARVTAVVLLFMIATGGEIWQRRTGAASRIAVAPAQRRVAPSSSPCRRPERRRAATAISFRTEKGPRRPARRSGATARETS